MLDKNKINLIEQIYREHKDHIYNYIHRMCNDPQLSQDVVQTTFIKLMTDPVITNVEHQKAYLFTIARNTLFDEMKRKKPVYFEDTEKMQEIAETDDNVSLQQATENEVLATVIDKAIYTMPEKFRELMLLRYTEDLSIQEIADITGRKLSDIKVNLHRARLSFENRFSATMYSRIAVSRERCETLINMITPFGDGDIPENDIPIIEMHIAGCTSCNEDATQMKRRRELFALVPILVASGLWEDIMKEAQASTLTLTQNNQSQNQTQGTNPDTDTSHLGSGYNSVAAVQTAAKVSSFKVASIAAITVVLAVTGFIIAKQFMDEDIQELIEPIARIDSQTPATPASPATTLSPATPATSPSASSTPPTASTASAPTLTASSTDQTTKSQSIEASKPQPAEQLAKLETQQTASEPKSKADPTKTAIVKSKNNDTGNKDWFYKGPAFKGIEEEIINNEKTVSTVYMSEYGTRMEGDDGQNGKFISLTNFEKRRGWMIDPDRKVYIDMQLDDEGNSKILPAPERSMRMTNIYDITPCSNFDISKKLGMDTIAGRSVEKWGCADSKTRQQTVQWFDPSLKLIVAEENNDIGKNIIKEINLQAIDKSLYELPNDYKEVSMNEFMMMDQQPR